MKSVLITGASGGIGSAIAVRFANAGYKVVLQYHSNVQGALDAVSKFPPDTTYLCVPCNLCDRDAISEMAQTVHQRIGAISVLVNCAGVSLPQMLFSDTSDDDYQKVLETNLHSMLRITKAFLEDLRKQRGSIVNISSIWGIGGGSCEVLYATSKAAVIGFTRSLSKELAPSGVTVNCVAPGLIDTAMNAHLSKETIETFRSDTPLNRLGTPEDIADAVFYLSSASFVSGQTLCVDGGYLN